MVQPIRLALIGAGIFARDAHVPAIKALGDRFEIAAIYSRTRETAESLLPDHPGSPDVYTDLGELLKRPDIEAVDVLLSIEALAAAVDMALAAGKHVVSEKPITPDVATGKRLLNVQRAHPQQVWMVAENWRYEASFRRAGEIVRSGEIGKSLMADFPLYIRVDTNNKYYHTTWRRSGTFPGGFLLDGGVHHVAAMRQILGEITSVSAQVKQMRADLPPADTMTAIIEFQSGAIGSYSVTFAAGDSFPSCLTVIGEHGALRVNDTMLEVTVNGALRREALAKSQSIDDELAAFADAIRSGMPHRNSPLEALHDVAVIEAMLKSGESRQRVEVENLADVGTLA